MPEVEPAKYSQTLNLPQTNFPMRGDLPNKEPHWLDFWNQSEVYKKLQNRKKKFVLHDGPPYANGSIHIGHALNKILKDIVIKSRALEGLATPYTPGWDCHGLPIEAALLKEKKMSQRGIKDVPGFRKEAAAFAERFIGIQKEDFKRLGVLGDWDNPYRTMTKEYEAEVISAFRKLYAKGLIYRGLKPVYWCISCETALAEAEIEYKDKVSPSVYVAFPLANPRPEFTGAEILIWTTTPWTLPGNRAVALSASLPYELATFSIAGEKRRFFIGCRREAIAQAIKGEFCGTTKLRNDSLSPDSMQGMLIVGDPGNSSLQYKLPYPNQQKSIGPAVAVDYVTAEDGTGIVHTAPGHGPDDFETGKKFNLEAFGPVGPDGRFTHDAPEFLRGLKVFPEGNEAVIADLKKRGMLLAEEKITHSYPHCWRCKNPIIFRATEQWFLSLDQAQSLRGNLLKAIDQVTWIPEAGKGRISSMVSNRPDWCLSRQRLWGTPIPILYCASCKSVIPAEAGIQTHMETGPRPTDCRGDENYIVAIEDEVRKNGDDFWFENWDAPVNHATWPFLPKNLKCSCGSENFIREKDILDVWMDSGVSWASVLKEGEYPADLYLEGSDQHRGWFQSSLVMSVGVNGEAPYKKVLTHGFVLDEKGRAMHKSTGNVVSPQEVIKKYGADILRLWVALSDYSDDVRISDKILEGPIESYRKIRNTLRYLLGNTADFDPRHDAVPLENLPTLEKYVLGRVNVLQSSVLSDYEAFQFRAAARKIVDFCAFDLSAFYCDIVKDRLYTLAKNNAARRASQTVLAECLTRLLSLAAPILPFTTEEAWQEGPMRWSGIESVLLSQLQKNSPLIEGADGSVIEQVRGIRELAQKKLEEARVAKVIGSSLEAKVRLTGKLPEPVSNWEELLIVSQVEIVKKDSELGIEVSRADGEKCPRCWRYQVDIGESKQHPELCGRCAQNLG